MTACPSRAPVRLAIGAGRLRLIRLLLTESLILALLSGLGGIVIGYGVVEWFHSKQSIIFLDELPSAVPFHNTGGSRAVA
jgi:ABC-type antimicrobial peptide transport system permease subunit